MVDGLGTTDGISARDRDMPELACVMVSSEAIMAEVAIGCLVMVSIVVTRAAEVRLVIKDIDSHKVVARSIMVVREVGITVVLAMAVSAVVKAVPAQR